MIRTELVVDGADLDPLRKTSTSRLIRGRRNKIKARTINQTLGAVYTI